MPSISPQNIHQSSLVPYQNFEEPPSQISTFLTRFGVDSSIVQKVEVAARILQSPLTAFAICLVLMKVHDIYSGYMRHQHLLRTDRAYKELHLSDAEYQQLLDNTPIDPTEMTQNEAWGFLMGGKELYKKTHRAEEAYRQLLASHPI